jgi:predicted phage terminase large subunit-like protein
MSVKLARLGHIQRKNYLEEYYAIHTNKEIALACGVLERTIDRDIAQWKASGEYDEWLDRRWHYYLESETIPDIEKFRALTRLKERRIAKLSLSKIEHSGKIRHDITNLLEEYHSLFKKTILENQWIPYSHREGVLKNPKQIAFLKLTCREAMYGGAAGGGKSEALLMGALQFADIPKYNAILFRRTYRDLALPESLMDRAMQWLGGTTARWNSLKHMWTFPNGARLAFGNLEHENDKYAYQSAEFQYIGFDELTQFMESQYRYLFSRLRRLEGINIPLRMRSATNPGGVGHDWVKRRFINEESSQGRIFIPAKLGDNPHIDQAQYIESLKELDPITRRQLLGGDWTARHGGSIFKREYFKDRLIRQAPLNVKRLVRYWDRAATAPKKDTDPDYTVGLKLGELEGQYYMYPIVRFRGSPKENEDKIKTTAQADGYSVHQRMEQEPGSSGVDTIDYYHRVVLKGFNFKGVKTTGDKQERAAPIATVAEAGNLYIIQQSLINIILDELEAFPLGSHDDIVDALSGAYHQLRTKRSYGARFVNR